MPAAVHGGIQPADVRLGDPVFARVRLSTARREDEVEARVWRISPLGVEIVKPEGAAGLGAGAAIDLSLQIGLDLAHFRGLEIASVKEERGRELLGARWPEAAGAAGEAFHRHAGACFRCEGEYFPTGFAHCSARYDDFFHFRIAEISRSGMQLLTDLRNSFLVPGVTFRGTCSFPTLEQLEIDFQVVHARVVKEGVKDTLSLGATWRADGPRAAETIGQYLLHFGPGVTPDQLRQEGFRVRSTSRAFEFGSVRSPGDYHQVLALRRLAYVHAGKLSPEAKDEEMGDPLDARSRIITAKYRGRLVGSIRVTFPRSQSDRLKHEEYCALPGSLPPRSEMVEMSKACTHPDFRGSDLFYSVIKRGALVALQARRKYILMSCTDALHGLYRRLGFDDLGVTYVHQTMGLEHHVMLGEVAAMASGRMNPIAWNVAIGPELWSFASLCGVVPHSPWRNARIRLLRALKPLVYLARVHSHMARRRRMPR